VVWPDVLATCESVAVIAERLTEYSNDDLVLDVVDSGPIDGTPAVLLHGFPQRATSWSAVTPHLHDRGMRTFALDQRGYAPRARPRSRRDYRAPKLVSDVHALVTAIGEPVHLVGHDWGAAGAWGVAAHHPGSLLSLTAVSVPHPSAFIRSFARSTQALKSYYMALFQIPFLPEWLLSRRGGIGDWLLRNSGMTREMVDTYHREIVEDGALRGALAWYRALPVTSPREFPGRVSVPTTLVWSDGDVAIGRKAIELTARFVTADYQLEVMEGSSHWLPNEQPAELATIIAKRAGL
jgi:pimeloyl-ACP methyl ester carboxylesterase